MKALARFRWQGAAVAWFVCVVGWAAIWFSPDRYLASGRVRIDPAAVLASGAGTSPGTPSQLLVPLREALFSREVLQRVAVLAHDGKGQPVDPESIQALVEQVDLTIGPQDEAFLVQYRDARPDAAMHGLQALLTVLTETFRPVPAGARTEAPPPTAGDAGTRRGEFENRVAETARALAAAQAALEENRRRPVPAAPASTGPSSHLDEYATLATQTRAELKAAEAARDGLRKRLAGEREWTVREMPAPPSQAEAEPEPAPATESAADAEIEARIRAVRESLEQMRIKYTEEHPDVVSARHVLEILIDQRERRQEAARKTDEERRAQREKARAARLARDRTATVQTRERNPVYDQIQGSLAQQDALVSALRAKLAEYDRVLQGPRDTGARPAVAGPDTAALTREVERLRLAHEEAIVRRDALPPGPSPTLATRAPAQAPTSAEAVRLVEAPVVTLATPPAARAWAASAVLAAGVLAGLATALLLVRRRPVFHDTRALGKIAGLPVLGSISRIAGDAGAQSKAGAAFAYAAACLALLGCYAAMLGIITHGLRLSA